MSDHIKKLVLKNWVSFKKGVFNFHPGVNMIIGPTDHGKSAAMSAIRKMMENRPMGSDFQSWWGGTTYIGLHLDNSIMKYKKNKKALYQIKDIKTGKVIEFNAVRASVPQEITNMLRLNRKINIQRQLEKKAPIFLLSETSSDIARHLNEVANLTNIDISLDKGKKDLAGDLKEKKEVEAQIKEKKKKLVKFKNLDALKILVNQAEKVKNRIELNKQKIDIFSSSVDLIKVQLQKLGDINKLLKVRPIIDKAVLIRNKMEKYKKDFNLLQSKLDELVDTKNKLDWIQNRLEVEPYIHRAFNFVKTQERYLDQVYNIEKKLFVIKAKEKKRVQNRKELKEKQKRFKKIFPDICPLCNSKVERNQL